MRDSNEAKKPWHHPSYGGMSESSAKASWEASRDRTAKMKNDNPIDRPPLTGPVGMLVHGRLGR